MGESEKNASRDGGHTEGNETETGAQILDVVRGCLNNRVPRRLNPAGPAPANDIRKEWARVSMPRRM